MTIEDRLTKFGVKRAKVYYNESQRTYLVKVSHKDCEQLNAYSISCKTIDDVTIADCFFSSLSFFESLFIHGIKHGSKH